MWQTSRWDRSNWPTGSGFEHFYGFIGGETNQYYPALYERHHAGRAPKTPEEGYHFTEDMTDQAIEWVRPQKSLMPDKPFFVYSPRRDARAAPRAARVVGEVQGPFDQGWDASGRRRSPARRNSGSSRLTRAHVRPDEIPAVGRRYPTT